MTDIMIFAIVVFCAYLFTEWRVNLLKKDVEVLQDEVTALKNALNIK